MRTSFIAQSHRAEPPIPDTTHEIDRTSFLTVALIGPDGSGKTSVAKALVESCPLPIKYLYMGTSIESSNVALPTSRLIHKWKVYRHKKSLKRNGVKVPEKVTLHGLEHRVERRGKIGGVLRLLRRVSEESYRQLVSWIYQLQGNVVLYDRHFLFDACPPPTDRSRRRLTDRMHHWFLRKCYPRPGLAIFLDAPSDVLYARKQEVPQDYLERDRQNLSSKSCYAKKFITVDSTQPLEEVVDLVKELMIDHARKR
jgi:thymidylate kinase